MKGKFQHSMLNIVASVPICKCIVGGDGGGGVGGGGRGIEV